MYEQNLLFIINWVRGTYSISTGIPNEMPCTQHGTHTTERKEEVGVLVWHILAPVDFLPDSVACPANMYGVYNQVKVLKLSGSLSSRSGGVSFPQVGSFS